MGVTRMPAKSKIHLSWKQRRYMVTRRLNQRLWEPSWEEEHSARIKAEMTDEPPIPAPTVTTSQIITAFEPDTELECLACQ